MRAGLSSERLAKALGYITCRGELRKNKQRPQLREAILEALDARGVLGEGFGFAVDSVESAFLAGVRAQNNATFKNRRIMSKGAM